MSKNTTSSVLLDTIVEACKDIKAENLLSIDFENVERASFDAFLICEGTSSKHIEGIADKISRMVKEQQHETPYSVAGLNNNSSWIVLDYISVVVHIFLKEERAFYNLEDFWSDGIMKTH